MYNCIIYPKVIHPSFWKIDSKRVIHPSLWRIGSAKVIRETIISNANGAQYFYKHPRFFLNIFKIYMFLFYLLSRHLFPKFLFVLVTFIHTLNRRFTNVVVYQLGVKLMFWLFYRWTNCTKNIQWSEVTKVHISRLQSGRPACHKTNRKCSIKIRHRIETDFTNCKYRWIKRVEKLFDGVLAIPYMEILQTYCLPLLWELMVIHHY